MKKIFMFFWTIWTRLFFSLNQKKFLLLKKKEFKIAVLKPYFYLDLYTEISKNYEDIIYSSYFRFGPVGLFSDLNSDFYITRTSDEKDFENRIKKRVKTDENKKLINLQKKNSIEENKIDYQKYDLILCYEGAVSKQTVKKYPKIKWGIILEDHSNNNYKKFLLFKPNPYDFFLNLTQGFTPYSIFKRNHSIDFSYTFSSSNFLNKMNIKKTHTIDVVIEIQQPNYVMSLLNKKNINVEKLDGNLKIKDYINKLSTSKIFFCPIFTSPRWGNSIIEASLCQNLIIGNKTGYWNSLLIHDDLHCTSNEKGIEIINKILSNQKLYDYYLSEQNKILEFINYNLPLNQINKIL